MPLLRRGPIARRALPAMRRLAAVAAALFVVTGAHPAVAQRTAIIHGRVILGTTDDGVGGARVTLLRARLDGSGSVTERQDVTDDDGRFAFSVSKREGVEYALEVRYDGGLFVGASFPAKGAGVASNVEVWPTTSDPSVITVSNDRMLVAHNADGASVVQHVVVENNSQRAYIGRGRALGADDSGSGPTLGFGLPTQAAGARVDLIDSNLNRLYATETDFGFAATVAIPPGETTVTFSYPAEGTGGSFDLSRRMLYPTEEVSVLVSEPLDLEAGRLSYDGVDEVGGEPYRVWNSDRPFDAGDVVSILAIARGEASSDLWLGLGVGLGAIVLLSAAGVWWTSRRRRERAERSTTRANRTQDRPADEDLVAAIAALDLERESGALSEEQWHAKRSALKEKLLADKQRETTS
ncbi:MAG: hypothetical protein M3174_06115 [Actinomycetota bacterium]|nr:hypothetical protein [Actinomycetota bacterium]